MQTFMEFLNSFGSIFNIFLIDSGGLRPVMSGVVGPHFKLKLFSFSPGVVQIIFLIFFFRMVLLLLVGPNQILLALFMNHLNLNFLQDVVFFSQ